MIKVYTAITSDIDDPKAAVKEILEQLRPEENALKNTVGLVGFHHEFADAGTLKAVADELPFECAGCVSSYTGTCGMVGGISMSVTMLTSDDANFSVKTIENLNDKTGEQITAELEALCGELCKDETPKIVFPYLPYLGHFSGDNLVETANALENPIPFFGTIAYNTEEVANTHYTFANGKFSTDTFVLVSFYGEVNPKIRHINALIYDESFGGNPVVTEVDKTILKSLDGISVVDYLKKIGMINDENDVSHWMTAVIPVIFTEPDGTKVVRQIVSVVEGTRYANITGFVKQGSTITFANASGDKTLSSTEKIFSEMLGDKTDNAVIFSCAGRAWSLGTNFMGEAQKVAECVNDHEAASGTAGSFKYFLTYSGGEILPVWNNDGRLVNTLQNYTLIACTFE